jgi:preprotein translocase subunit SecE
VAKQDEVEPTDGSDAAEPFDATDELTVDQPAEGETVDTSQRDVQGEDEEAGESADKDPDNVEPVDEFDQIVRNSGVDHSGEEDPDGDTHGPTDNGAAKVLEPAGVAATTTGSRAGERGQAPARTPKTAATAKRDQPVKQERTTPLKFVRQSIGELRKVVYPTGQQLINYFIVVLVFVLFVIAYVSLLDLGLGAAIFRIFS